MAIIVPDEEKFMKEYGNGRTFEEACADPETAANFLVAINKFAREDGVKGSAGGPGPENRQRRLGQWLRPG